MPRRHAEVAAEPWWSYVAVSDDVMDYLEAGPLSGRDWELGYM